MRTINKGILPLTNRLLAALPQAELDRLAPHLHQAKLSRNSILYDAGDEVRRAYFLQSGVISLISVSENDDSIEAGVVGCEGMVGIPGILRYRRASLRAVVQVPGEAFSVDAGVLRREFKRGGELQEIILCFTHTLVSQFARSIVCSRFHTVEKRLSRWLLMTHDRVRGDTFHLTHAFIADMLGAARTDVTKAAGALQDAELIRYRRGAITILDKEGLESVTCGCYRAIKEETDQFIAA
jgi:CRP-like cAMP-binding protein